MSFWGPGRGSTVQGCHGGAGGRLVPPTGLQDNPPESDPHNPDATDEARTKVSRLDDVNCVDQKKNLRDCHEDRTSGSSKRVGLPEQQRSSTHQGPRAGTSNFHGRTWRQRGGEVLKFFGVMDGHIREASQHEPPKSLLQCLGPYLKGRSTPAVSRLRTARG